jgi:hypothetical protein
MFKINNIELLTVPCYYNEEYLGEVNYFQFMDLRIQVKEYFKADNNTLENSGVYFIYKDERLDMLKSSRFKYWPEGFFDQESKNLAILAKSYSDRIRIKAPKVEE